MSVRQITDQTLGLLDDGRAAIVINNELEKALADAFDRGADGKPRTVTIKIKILRIDDERVDCHAEALATLPPFRTAVHKMELREKQGKTVGLFQEYDRDQPKQQRIEDLAEGEV